MNKLHKKNQCLESLTLRIYADNELKCNELGQNSKKTATKLRQNLLELGNEDFPSSKKKMYQSLTTRETLEVNHYPAVLRETKGNWQIEFYCINPYSRRMERVRYRVNKYRTQLKSDPLARKEIRKIITNINVKLSTGWTPFVDQSPFNLITMEKSIENFLFYKKNELRHESNHSYTSQLNMFRDWLKSKSYLNLMPSDFSKNHAMAYMDYVSLDKKVSNRTYNNYRGFLRIYFNWMIERGYCGTNPFSQMKPKRNEKKERQIIPLEDRRKIVDYIRDNHYSLFIFILLEYSCLLRPIEILRTKFEDYDLEKQIIHLVPKKTKNADIGNVVIPNNTIELLRNYFKYIEADKYDKDTFVFSTKLLPGTIEKTTRYPGGIWAEIRKKLNFPKEYKLYSLRDTSITELLLSNIPTISVQKHARHSSLEMTQIYADHITPKMLEDIKTNTTNLF